ncbi:MAG: hypothetical protein FIB01_16580 [Gemmatimonadetes bacterium]|nr:hypothetical protein [Gemmatimonadota bacterium]
MQLRAGAPIEAPRRRLWLRAGELLLGLALWGLATALMVKSGLGLGPWDAFHVGLHLQTGLSIGAATIVTAALILAVTLVMRVRPGVALVVNTVMIGVFVDLFLPLVPASSSLLGASAYFAAALLLGGLATGLYIGAGFGQGPRDALMLALHERTGWSVRRARGVLEAAVLAAGWLMGGRVGVGTIVYALAIGPAVQWGLALFAQPTSPAARHEAHPGARGFRLHRRAA